MAARSRTYSWAYKYFLFFAFISQMFGFGMSRNGKVYACFRGKATNAYLNDQGRIYGEIQWKLFLAV